MDKVDSVEDESTVTSEEYNDAVKPANELLKSALLDAGRVARFLQHSAETYAYFSDDPNLLAAKALSERMIKKLEKLQQPLELE